MVEANGPGTFSMIDTTNGASGSQAGTRNVHAVPAMGRSFQIDKRPVSVTTKVLSSTTEPAPTEAPSTEATPTEAPAATISNLPPPPRIDAQPSDQQQTEDFSQSTAPIKTVFNLQAVQNSDLYTSMKPMPYKVTKDRDEIEMKCELCLDLPCCPEHCCNWDTCSCKHCDQCSENKPTGPQRPGSAYRKVFNPRSFAEEFVETNEPELFIRGDLAAQAQPEQVRPKKKVAITSRDVEAQRALESADAEKEHTETVPRELITTEEGTLIQNFEVDFGPEEELVMAGGIRGIRALRVQRAAIEEQIAVPTTEEEAKGEDRFSKYGGKVAGEGLGQQAAQQEESKQ